MPPHQLLFEQTRRGSPQMYFSTGSRRGKAPHLTAGRTEAVHLQRRAAFRPAAKFSLSVPGSEPLKVEVAG
jgi:hypothetical protein